MNYLIIGNGIAGIEAAMTIRKEDKEANISIISESKRLLYYRPRLIEHLAGKVDYSKILVYTMEKYQENNIELIQGKKAVRIDWSEKKVETADGEIYKYDKLLIATGSKPFIPPVEGLGKEGIFSFRSINDSERMREYCESKNIKEAIIVGGGLLGIETANSLSDLGVEVTIVEFFDRILPNQLDDEGSKILESKLRDKGIKFELGESVESINGNINVESVTLKSGKKLKGNMLIFSTGIRSNCQLAREVELDINKGILVNSMLETSKKDIYAAGDVAEYKGMVYGLWIPAKEQGKLAGLNMTGNKTEYTGTALEARLKVTGISLFSAGDFTQENLTIKKYHKDGVYRKFFIRDKKLEAAIIIGDNKAAIDTGKVFEGRASLEILEKYMS